MHLKTPNINMMPIIRSVTIISAFFLFILTPMLLVIYPTIYKKHCQKSSYLIEIELMNGSKDTIVRTLPSTYSLDIRCEYTCRLGGRFTPEFRNGYSRQFHPIRDGVINFKVLRKKVLSHETMENDFQF